MNVLVTGATGFLGQGIVTSLRAAGHRVIGASRGSADGLESVRLDVTSREDCARAFRQAGPIDTVVHAAALAHVRLSEADEERCHDVNVAGTANVLAAAQDAGVKRFVFISSVMVYGELDLPRGVTEERALRAMGAYGRAKIMGEDACETASGEIDVYILRMVAMYDRGWLRNVRKQVRPFTRGRPLYFTLDPDRPRYSLCSRPNGAQAVRWAVERRLAPGVYNVADRQIYTQRDIFALVVREDGAGPIIPVPRWVPRMMMLAVRALVPIPSWRFNARCRFARFCEDNVYSTAKLQHTGLSAPAHLVTMGSDSLTPGRAARLRGPGTHDT